MVELDISVCSIGWKENERGVLEKVASKIDDGEILLICVYEWACYCGTEVKGCESMHGR